MTVVKSIILPAVILIYGLNEISLVPYWSIIRYFIYLSKLYFVGDKQIKVTTYNSPSSSTEAFSNF